MLKLDFDSFDSGTLTQKEKDRVRAWSKQYLSLTDLRDLKEVLFCETVKKPNPKRLLRLARHNLVYADGSRLRVTANGYLVCLLDPRLRPSN